jgi:hypothetical protein
MIAGVGVGFLGGIIAIAAMAYSWTGGLDCLGAVAINMLIATMFFAVAGGFTSYAPVKGKTLVVLAVVLAASTVFAAAYATTFVAIEAVMIVLAIVEIFCAACPTVTKWVDTARSA